MAFAKRERVVLIFHQDKTFFLGLLGDGFDVGFEFVFFAGEITLVVTFATAGSRFDAEGVIEGHGVFASHLFSGKGDGEQGAEAKEGPRPDFTFEKTHEVILLWGRGSRSPLSFRIMR